MMLEVISGMASHLYKMCSDHVIRRCVPNEKNLNILQSCHVVVYGRHFRGHRTIAKVLQSSYYWPFIFKDAYEFVKCYDKRQRIGHL